MMNTPPRFINYNSMDLRNFKVPVAKKEFSGIVNKRQYLIKQFLDKLNSERGNFKPLTPARVAVMLSPITTDNLEGFYEECKAANHFSKFFYYSCNPKNIKKT